MLAPVITLALAGVVHGHTAAWANGMFCKGGPNPNVDDSNTNTAVNPLYQLPKSSWWFQHDRGCDLVPPPSGEFLQLPAGQSFTVELAHNRAQTTLSYGGSQTSDWPDGLNHPDNYGPVNGAECVSDGALHTVNEQTAGGTAFAISYVSSISDVTMENLVVFTTLEHTPWKRLATYQVPTALPACPDGGCICAWLWVPNGCGTPNMYMQGFKCKVTGATSTVPVAKAQVPTYCADDSSKCVKGAKQIIAWNQLDGNNIVNPPGTPNYNTKNGWASGAQNDIFVTSTPPTSSWNAIGCYIDTSARILPNKVNVSGGLTNNACKTACQAAGYKFAGTEIESECWCGNSLSSGATQVDISQCNLACSSNTGEQCGGVWRLRAFALK